MADHRVTDLFYGHLGELRYDSNKSTWTWSRALFSCIRRPGKRYEWLTFGADAHAEVLQNFEQYAPSTIQHVPERRTKASSIAREVLRRITRCYPEVFPANMTITGAPRLTSEIDAPHRIGALLSVGSAVDYANASGSRRPQVIAMPCGEAGHILKLIRPRYASLGWGPQSAATLRLIGPGFLDQGHWLGTGGRILQICFAEDINRSSAWLIVRQSSATTIFRPFYNTSPISSHGLKAPMDMEFMSRIVPNPVAALPADMSGSQYLVDVSFNPWYSRQFAVVDELGSWSVWDIEGHMNSMSDIKLVQSSSGNMNDKTVVDPVSDTESPHVHDGWHRILWASNLTTIVTCDRRTVAVFEVKAKPFRLQSCVLIAQNSMDVILDIKRSSSNLSQLFVLTTTRIFWLEVNPFAEEKDAPIDPVGAKIILSYRHDRDGSDDALKLTTVNDQRGVSVTSASTRSI